MSEDWPYVPPPGSKPLAKDAPERKNLTPAAPSIRQGRSPNGDGPRITAIPTFYKGITFRSGLEADWSATLDVWSWHWNYEPVGLSVNGQNYLPDFFLPHQNVWLEVKGLHNERIDKTARLAQEIDFDEDDVKRALVVLLRAAGPGDRAIWEGALPGMNVVISTCPVCDAETFVDLEGIWICRVCWQGQALTDRSRLWATNYQTSGQRPFHRAPRPARAA